MRLIIRYDHSSGVIQTVGVGKFIGTDSGSMILHLPGSSLGIDLGYFFRRSYLYSATDLGLYLPSKLLDVLSVDRTA